MAHKIEFMELDQLEPYTKNSRVHSEEQIDQIINSIEEFGFTNPVLIDGKNGIIAGHGRVEAATRMGIEKVPCVRLGHLSEAQKRAYIIADNKLALNATWDDDILSEELILLKEDEFDLELVGFSDEELADLLPPEVEEKKSDFIDDLEKYTSKIETPIYEIKGEKPAINELFKTIKSESLIKKIQSSEIPEEEKKFLIHAAGRHTEFNYRNIAEFYAHSSKETQELMEDSALVIIDFKKAIENGFVKLTKKLAESYRDEIDG